MAEKLHGEEQYLSCLKKILAEGKLVPNRTGVAAYVFPHMLLQHDMSLGFPLLTTKKMAWKTIKVELEGFIKGITDKQWFKERGCHIWDEWCNPKKIPPNLEGEQRKKFQLEENDLGPIYGAIWRNFNNQNYDQLEKIVTTLKNNPTDRRLLCTAWNPLVLEEQALPPCHVLFHLTVVEDVLHLCWFQRSVDFFLGVGFNLASYALLLHLLALESGLQAGVVSGMLSNCHIYDNHIEAVETQLNNSPFQLPTIETPNFVSIFEWDHSQTRLIDYKSHEKISAPVAV